MNGSNVRLLSELDSDSSPEVHEHEPEVRKNGSFQESAFDRIFQEGVERFGLKDDDDAPAPASRQSGPPPTKDEIRTRSLKSLDDKFDEQINAHFEGEDNRKAFETSKGLAARDYLNGAFGDLGKFGDIVERFLEYGRAFQKDSIGAAEHFIRDFRSSRFRADRAEQLKVDRTPPEIEGHRRDWFIEQSMGHVERGDTLTKAQIKELKELFPGTSIDGIIDNIATLAKDAFADPMNVAAKLAHATGAPRTEAELETWLQQENQRQQQLQTGQARQREVGQYLHNTATRIMQLPQFPRTGNYETDYRAAHHAAQAQYNEHVEMEGAHRQIGEFAAQRPPLFDHLRGAMAAHLQNGHCATLEEAYKLAAAPFRDVIADQRRAVARARRAAPIRSSTGSYAGRSGGNNSLSGLDAKLSDAIDRFYN